MTSFSQETTQLLRDLDALSGHTLTRQNDLAALVDIALREGKQSMLADLSFHAKFVVRAHKIMTRIGKEGEGYENLAREFTAGVERASGLVRGLINDAPLEFQHHVTATYLRLTRDTLQNLLDLFADLSWYKNWQIDHPDDVQR
jgi:hypothetical protein